MAQIECNNHIVANGEKTGSYNYDDHSITWNILMNEDCSTIENPIITDTIADGLELNPDSINIYTVNMASGGSYTKRER